MDELYAGAAFGLLVILAMGVSFLAGVTLTRIIFRQNLEKENNLWRDLKP